MSATGQVPARGRRHPMTVVTQARRLAEGGWRPYEIRDLLAKDGVRVELNTIARWTDPKKQDAADRRARERRRREAAEKDGRIAKHIARTATDEFKFARMRALRLRDLGYRSIAVVMAFDFGDDWLTEDKVRYALVETGRYPKERES